MHDVAAAKHKNHGWYNAEIIGVQDGLYTVQWQDGDESDKVKTVNQLRPRKTLELESATLTEGGRGCSSRGEGSARHGGPLSWAAKGREGPAAAAAKQKVVPDVAVREVGSGVYKGQAGAFAARRFAAGEVISCYAGKLAFSSTVRKQAGEMLKMQTVAKWPVGQGCRGLVGEREVCEHGGWGEVWKHGG